MRVAPGESRTCGDCAWSFPGNYGSRILRCRQASGARVNAEDRACTKGEFALDCQECGACCAGAFSDVPVEERDVIRKRRPELVTLKRIGWVMNRVGEDCVGLSRDGADCTCTLYDIRPTACRDFASGSEDCLAARKAAGPPGRPQGG